jgi:serine/threonine-protein kinase
MHKPSPDPSRDATTVINADSLANDMVHLENPVSSAGPISSPDSEDELLGRRINDNYLIDSVLGEGGMGRVYRARHTRIPQKVFAIKVLRPDLARDPDQLARFQREAEAAACVSHPNVVGVYDVGRTVDGWSYIVCELLSGHDLDAHIERQGRMDVVTTVRAALQVCDALSAAHQEGVVHRDLKPQNVFLLADETGRVPAHPRVKVLDFGLSRFLDTGDAQLTKTGMIMGTPSFMAPEQANGQRGDHRVDIYGIGAILYACLTGRAPFEEDTLHATVLAVMMNEAKRPRELNPDIPETLELVIQRAMAKNPEQRYANVRELRADLEAFDPALSAAVLAAPASAVGVPASKARRASRTALAADVYEVATARPRLLFYLLLAASVLIAFLASSVAGLEIFTGKLAFTRTELALLLLGICGTLLMPAGLWIRRFRRTVWSNSARVLDLLEVIRRPVLTGLLAYGLAVIVLRFCDDFVGRFGFQGMFQESPGIAWPGWTLLLPLVAFVASGMSVLRQRWGAGEVSRLRRHLLGAPFLAVTASVVIGILALGLDWRGRTHGAEAIADFVTHVGTAKAAPAVPEGASSKVNGDAPAVQAAVPAPAEPIKRATDDELATAMAKGVEGLLPLSEQYPKDAGVLEPLMMAFASRATTISDAMAVAERLFAVAPEKADDAGVGMLVKRGAQTPGNAEKLALRLMSEVMGESGADLLYDLYTSSKIEASLRSEVEKRLAKPEVQQKFSPALRIAYELRRSPSCDARLPLLPRASQLGDERSVAVLLPLGTGSKRGCGRWKRNPCPAQCDAEGKSYLETVRDISLRLAGTPR